MGGQAGCPPDPHGGYGIIERDLGRSLLWRRGFEETLVPIEFPDSMVVPSWSWMAWMGGIAYFDLIDEDIEWQPITSPYSNQGCLIASDRWPSKRPAPALVGEAHDFETLAAGSTTLTVVWDRAEYERKKDIKCVVVGISREDPKTMMRSYYLLIVGKRDDGQAWERLGVGCEEGKDLFELDGESFQVSIW